MKNFDRFEYLQSIPATPENATNIQDLALQDFVAGNFYKPTSLADPEDPDKVAAQLEELSQNPERYSGYRHESGLLVAYMKSGEWRIDDELPFVKNTSATRVLRVASMTRRGSLSPKAHGVFSLVANESLIDQDR